MLEDRSLPSGSAPSLAFADKLLSTPYGLMVVTRQIALPGGDELQVGTIRASDGAWDFAVARTNPNGQFDRSFGVNGVVETNIPGDSSALFNSLATDVAYDVLVQPDGKYVVVGGAEGYGYLGMALVRYNQDGSLDSTFGDNGVCPADVGGGTASAVLQPDGKIVVAGDSTEEFGSPDVTVARFNADGTLDTSFGDLGFTRLSVDGQNAAYGDAVVLQPNGQIVVAGTADTLSAMNDLFGLTGFRDGFPQDTFCRRCHAGLNAGRTVDNSFYCDGAVVVPMTAANTMGVDGVSVKAANGTITLMDGSSAYVVQEECRQPTMRLRPSINPPQRRRRPR